MGIINDSSIIGEWEYEGGGFVYCFRADGTGYYRFGGVNAEFTYTNDGSAVAILYPSNTIASSYKYRVDGNKLIIKDSLGKDVIYIKKS